MIISLTTVLRRCWQAVPALLLILLAIFRLPVLAETAPVPFSTPTTALIAAILAISAMISLMTLSKAVSAVVLFVGAHAGAFLLLAGLAGNEGLARAPFFLLLAASWLLAWACVARLSEMRPLSDSGGAGLLNAAAGGATGTGLFAFAHRSIGVWGRAVSRSTRFIFILEVGRNRIALRVGIRD